MFVKAMFRAGVALLGALAFASAATADSIQVTRFSPHVTGNTGGSTNTVTVSLLRNTLVTAANGSADGVQRLRLR